MDNKYLMEIFVRNNLLLKVVTKRIFSNLMEINFFENISWTKYLLIEFCEEGEYVCVCVYIYIYKYFMIIDFKI